MSENFWDKIETENNYYIVIYLEFKINIIRQELLQH